MNKTHIPYNGVVLVKTTTQDAYVYSSVQDMLAAHCFEFDLPTLANIVSTRYHDFSFDAPSLGVLKMAVEQATAQAMARTLTNAGKKP